MAVRLPTVGSDTGNWGALLNAYLLAEHGADGAHSKPFTTHLTLKATIVTTGASYTLDATTDQIVIINKATGSATAVHLPASPLIGMLYTLKDGKGDAATHNITITPASGTIDGQSSLVICANYAAVNLVYTGTEWNIV